MRLIDADALIKETTEVRCVNCDRRKGMKNGKMTFVYEIGDVPCRACDVMDMIDALEEAPTVGGWISVKDRLPEAGKHVLADCEVRFISGRKKHYVCEAYYAPTHTISAGSFPEDYECYEYDEMDDNYYLLEGWYECIHNWDDYCVVIGDFVTHWMPLPEPPEEVSGDEQG